MKKLSLLLITLFISTTSFTTASFAADETSIYGSQLMTNQERTEHRERLLNAKNEQERQKIRKEHHERMKIRAQKSGVKLPDEPPMSGGAGMGKGKGKGMGKGKGR